MNGPQHYREAERLASLAADDEAIGEYDIPETRYNLAAAQIHATLALAAATVHGAIGNDLASTVDVDVLAAQAHEWLDAIATELKTRKAADQ